MSRRCARVGVFVSASTCNVIAMLPGASRRFPRQALVYLEEKFAMARVGEVEHD